MVCWQWFWGWKGCKDTTKYLYNGKELQEDLGLGVYHTKFRVLDPAIGKWWQIDPLSDKSNNQSPYSFVMNNPLRYSDAVGLDTLDEVVIRAKRIAVNYYFWFTGANVGYKGSGWGHGPRRYLANQIGLNNRANNLFELGLNSMLQSNEAKIEGGLLNKLKQDPAMVKFQNDIIKMLKSDPRFKNIKFITKGGKVVEFGGDRWRSQDENWGSLSSKNPLAHGETWSVAANELTWATRHANVNYSATVKSDGTIVISYKLSDTLDLSAQKGRSEAYNNISSGLGFLYHDLAGGNSGMKVSAEWQVETK